MGDFMNVPKRPLDDNLNIKYNERGESFESLLAQGIRQANFKAIQKQIIANAALVKESAKNE